jgi:hypothetical protein
MPTEQTAKDDAASAMLGALKNTRAYLAKHADKLPPMSLNGLDIAIAQAVAAGIRTEDR